jgi:hypothetical protein
VIFVDSNVPMYLVGGQHPHRSDAQNAIERLAARRERMVTDAEAFQEILHRYRALNRPGKIQPAFDFLLGVVDEVFAIEIHDVERAKDVLLERSQLSARDALHIAVMEHYGITKILSFDRAFDRVPGIDRLS